MNIYDRSQALGRQIQNMDSQFNTAFPGFNSYLNQAANSAESPAQDRYQRWSEQGRDNVKAALEAADLNTSTFESEGEQLDRMMTRSQSAVGRMQALQAGNEIASQNVQQLQSCAIWWLRKSTCRATIWLSRVTVQQPAKLPNSSLKRAKIHAAA